MLSTTGMSFLQLLKCEVTRYLQDSQSQAQSKVIQQYTAILSSVTATF